MGTNTEDMSDAVQLLSSGSYVVTRRGPSSFDSAGRRVEPATSTFKVLGSLQPLKGLELQRVPENLRNVEVMKFFSPLELKTVDTNEPDVIAADGVSWEVQSVQRWAPLGNFWRCLVARRP